MCRLYGFRANEPTKVECSLVHAQNALLSQSLSDLRGEAHPDGWGISCYEDHFPIIERRDTAAHEDERFSLAAERAYAQIVIAHVRKATVGGHSVDNTHPFVYDAWTFAHNGTLRGFDQLAGDMLEETDDDLKGLRLGRTDSEAIFLWLMSRLREACGGDPLPRPDQVTLVDTLSASIRELDARSRRTGVERLSRLNFLITDGRLLAGSCFRNTLYWVERDGVHDCEICGIPHVHHEPSRRYRAVVLASEPISHEDWNPVPDGSVVAVDGALSVSIQGL